MKKDTAWVFPVITHLQSAFTLLSAWGVYVVVVKVVNQYYHVITATLK